MTEPVILSYRTWTTKEPDPDDRHRLPVKIRWTETVVLRDATPEEKKAMREDGDAGIRDVKIPIGNGPGVDHLQGHLAGRFGV